MARLLALGELMRRSRCVAMVVALCFVCLSAAQAQQRVALVIGNGAYTGEAALPNAVRDAELVAEGFTSLGFRVTLHRNLDQAGLKRALQDFEVKAEGAEVAAIYFAGHGMGVDGTNWLLPVDARLASEKHVDDEAVAHTRFIRAVDSAKGLQIVILDACRNNPFARRLVQQKTASGRSVTARGLAPIPERDLLPANRLTPPSRLVAFSARDGEVAQDGPPGTNGPYARALRERMKLQKEIRILFGMVRDDVMEATRNKQQPWEYQSLGGTEFYLSQTVMVIPNHEAAELSFWQSIEGSRSQADFEGYLAQYPYGRFAALARKRLADIVTGPKTEGEPKPPKPVPPKKQDDLLTPTDRLEVSLKRSLHRRWNPTTGEATWAFEVTVRNPTSERARVLFVGKPVLLIPNYATGTGERYYCNAATLDCLDLFRQSTITDNSFVNLRLEKQNATTRRFEWMSLPPGESRSTKIIFSGPPLSSPTPDGYAHPPNAPVHGTLMIWFGDRPPQLDHTYLQTFAVVEPTR